MTTNNNQQNQNPFGTANNNPPNQNGSGTSRFGSASNQQNQNNNQNNTPASRFGSSRFGNANNQQNQNNNQNTNSPFASGSRLTNRFGQQTIFWTVAPINPAAVRISMDGLGDPFHRLLGTPLNLEYGKPEKVVAVLQSDEELLGRMMKVLQEAWESYQFQGAALLFPWDDDVKKAYSHPVYPSDTMPQDNSPNDPNNQNANDDDADWLDTRATDQKSNVTCLRAIDLAFVLNVLARSRANVIVANTPLALEPGFLSQTVVCDDPRIVAIARATGCIDENW